MVATAVSPVPPASHARPRRRLRVMLSLNDFGLAIGSGNASPRAGHHFVVDGADQIGPLLGGGLTAGAGTEEDRFVAFGHVDPTGTEVDQELVHADPADAAPTPTV